MLASERGYAEVVTLLIDARVDMDIKDQVSMLN